MTKQGRTNSNENYRYGFNGKEKDTWAADGNIYDYGFRIYNPQYAKFLSVDPLTKSYPELTPYQFASNTPIWAIDLDGLEALVYTEQEGVGHVFISVFNEKDVVVYTYGRYNGSYTPSSGAFGPLGNGVLVKYNGDKAREYINKHFKKGKSAKGYLIPDVDKNKVVEYFEEQWQGGVDVPEFVEKNGEQIKNEYYSFGKIIDTYILPGNNCTTKTRDGLKAGGFDVSIESLPYNPPSDIGIFAPQQLDLLFNIIINDDKFDNSISHDRIYDVTKQEKKNNETK